MGLANFLVYLLLHSFLLFQIAREISWVPNVWKWSINAELCLTEGNQGSQIGKKFTGAHPWTHNSCQDTNWSGFKKVWCGITLSGIYQVTEYWNLFHLSCIFNIHLKRPSWHKAWSLTEIFRLPENHDQAALRAVSPCLGRPKETLLAWYEQVYGGKRKSASLRSSRFLSFSKCSQTGGKLRKSPLAPPYFSPIFGLTPGVLLCSPAFSLLVRSLHHLKKERNWLLRRLEECSSELVK